MLLIEECYLKKIITICKRNTICPYCNYSNGIVKKISGSVFKIIHEKFRAKNVIIIIIIMI